MRHFTRPAGAGLVAALVALLVSANASSQSSTGFRVLHHESIQVASQKSVGKTERLSFEAYGRRFELTVAPNERISRGVPSTSRAVPLQGTVDGIANSWVRITRSPSGLRGMVFDGQAMYAIEPSAEVAQVAVQPLNGSDGGTVVYRLSDAVMPVETMSCEIATPDSTPDSPPTAADALEQLTAEMHSFDTAEANAIKQVRVGVVGDTEFVAQFNNLVTTPEDAIVARMNIVDGIFSSQLNVKVSLGTPRLYRPPETDPFTKSVASELLGEVRTFRRNSQAQQAFGITHLMTGRNLDTTTVGIAYITGVCDDEFGASLSQSMLNTNQAALIAAHEIGHNFGAPHDGEGACAATSNDFLMAPQLNGSDQFSACSVQQITPFVNNSTCLTTYAPPDASIQVTSPTLNATVGTALVASYMVRATGDDASANVTTTVSLPANLTLQSISANGGTCTSGAGTATCNLGSLAAGDSRQVDLNVTATASGTLALSLSVDSSNDPNAANDSGTITINASTTGAPPATPPTGGTDSSGGGGGGRLDLALLALLGALSFAAARSRRGFKMRP
jgi:hypothetical protein